MGKVTISCCRNMDHQHFEQANKSVQLLICMSMESPETPWYEQPRLSSLYTYIYDFIDTLNITS